MKGSVRIGSESTSHDPFHTLVLSADDGQNGVKLTATADNTEFVLVCLISTLSTRAESYALQIAGEPLDQTVVQYGPFVMTTREEIQKTLLDCE